MGSGKTTLGKILSKKLDKIFYDSDQVIEEKLGVDVSMIFEYEGEEGFREREKDILLELVSKKILFWLQVVALSFQNLTVIFCQKMG